MQRGLRRQTAAFRKTAAIRSAFLPGKKEALWRPSARLGASTWITKRSGTGHRDAESFTPFGHFLGGKENSLLQNRRFSDLSGFVLHQKRVTSPSPWPLFPTVDRSDSEARERCIQR